MTTLCLTVSKCRHAHDKVNSQCRRVAVISMPEERGQTATYSSLNSTVQRPKKVVKLLGIDRKIVRKSARWLSCSLKHL